MTHAENDGTLPGDLPYDSDHAERLWMKYLKLQRLHTELAGYYRAKSTDRKTIANLWYHIDGLELDLRSEGVTL
jgi:hypothetical protein